MKQARVLILLITLPCFPLAAQEMPVMISVEGGTFTMGDNTGNDDEKPAHSVTVKSFRLARTETTVAQWRAYATAVGLRMPEVPWFGLEDRQPIVNVSWDQANAYCQWLSVTTGQHYRLPTEAEWEFAARGGNKSRGYAFSGSNTVDSVAWISSKSNGPAPVATKKPNELGLYDMTGNVWEWCSDVYDAQYYATGKKEKPKGPLKGMFYTLRGGAWDQGPGNNRIPYRNPLAPTSRNHNKGFRVAAD